MTLIQLEIKWPTLVALVEAITGLALVLAPSLISRRLLTEKRHKTKEGLI